MSGDGGTPDAGDGGAARGGYRYADEHTPPPARRVSEVTVERFEHVFEVDPALMTVHVAQQLFPNWDTLRIAAGRADHLAWMHRHWAHTVVSGQEILDEIGDPEP
ncbi:hypothetical protein GCM10009801_79270 [Streptomyces albiaxialis]|uniref:Uncharacterized protein n=1 Tax=Streptomyces albiaxialis TaxID=329523 RepID=A0ABN2X4C2_9ACTN